MFNQTKAVDPLHAGHMPATSVSTPGSKGGGPNRWTGLAVALVGVLMARGVHLLVPAVGTLTWAVLLGFSLSLVAIAHLGPSSAWWWGHCP